MEWLFGELAQTGIQLPKNFDLKGILTLVLQVLGLTYANFRARAVTLLGEKTVAAIETVAEVFQKLISEGPGALWDWIKEKLGDLKAMVIDQIEDFIITKVITAGVTWLIGLLNPASAFFKACKAIYDIIMFFIERGSQIITLVNAIIDSLAAISAGSITGAAAMVENALAKAIPVVIGFMASLLGIGGLGEKIKSIIETIRKPINAAIDWVIGKAVQLVKAAGKFVGGLFGGNDGKKETDPHAGDPEKKDELDGDYIYEQPDTGGHVLRIRTDLKVFRFSTNPTPVSGAAAQKVEQAALEKIVPRGVVSYPDDLKNRAAGPSGNVKDVKDGEEREDLPSLSALSKDAPPYQRAYQPGDHRGHLIGDRFYGTPSRSNLVPMHQQLNLSTFKRFENSCASEYRSLKNADKAVLLYMKVVPSYPKDDPHDPASFRPTSVTAEGKTITLQSGPKPEAVEKAVPGGGAFANPDTGFVKPGMVNLNTGTGDEIAGLPGLNAAVATQIVAGRAKRPYWEYGDLLKTVPQLNAATLQQLQDQNLVRIR